MTTAPAPPADPNKSPSYPQRVHTLERAHWQAVLKTWEDRVAEVRHHLDAPVHRPGLARAYAQMLGALDQVADAARRLPLEVGDLYDEDKHRLEEAVAALERLSARWSAHAS
jgi:hypothetical protein